MFTSNKVRLRPPEITDIDLIYDWENNPEVWMISDTHAPFSKFVLKKYLEMAHLDIYQTCQLRMMIEATDTPDEKYPTIGTIDIFDFDPYHLRCGIGILIADTKYRRKGYAAEAIRLMLDYCFKTLGCLQVYCNIPSDNVPSLNLFRKIGFETAGCRRKWLNSPNGWIDDFMMQVFNPGKK